MEPAMASVKFYLRVLSGRQVQVLRRVGPVLSKHGWYLGGGTALALMMGHRRSNDLDWFHRTPTGVSRSWELLLQKAGVKTTPISVERGTLHVSANGVRMSLFEYAYPTLHRTIRWPKMQCRLASLDDIACMKLSAIAQRGARKDFVDIYALLKKHKPLESLFPLYQKKYGLKDVAPVMYGLSYYADAEREPMPFMLWSHTWRSMKAAIELAVKQEA
jgi:hypothetical protein